MVGGRTLSLPEGFVVVVDMGWLVNGEPDPSTSDPGRMRAVVNRGGADLLTHTVIHEGYHVLAHQRGTNFEVWGGGPERTEGWAEHLFRYFSALLVDECRTERAAHLRDPRPDDTADWGNALFSLGNGLRTAVSDYQRHLDVQLLTGQVVGEVAAPFWSARWGMPSAADRLHRRTWSFGTGTWGLAGQISSTRSTAFHLRTPRPPRRRSLC